MLNSLTKQKINNLRDLLVGKIPNPQGQVQQITLALIYKFMSDIDDANDGVFSNSTFFPGEFASYKWTHLMDSKLSAQERLNLYAEGLETMNHNPSVPALFRNIFKQAFLPFRDPQTLDRFLKQIDEFEYEHSEDLGDAFEYLLSCLSAAGDAGQFRTPRHIIDFIVAVVQPAMTDKILDPACGTAGFLISAYKYLLSQHNDLDMTKISQHIVGYDISPEMVQLALVNLYLHHFPDPKIEEYDTLTSDAKRSDKFDCILANPPFMTPKGGISPHNKFSITSNRSEVLFVDYIMEHLKSNGKAGIIVPEGVIFQSANAYKSLRKMLIEQGGLRAVVSLPAGVFNPYSGVKTSILLLDKSITTDHIIFAKITADGYDLGAQRRESSKNDLPVVLEELLQIKQGLMSVGTQFVASDGGSDRRDAGLPHPSPTDTASGCPYIRSVAKTDLADDYNLSAERYKTGSVAHTGSWEMVELGEVCELGRGFAFKSEDYCDNGILNFRVTNIGSDGKPDLRDSKFLPISFEQEYGNYLLQENDFMMVMVGATTGKIGLITKDILPALLNQNMRKFMPKEEIISRKFLYYIVKELEVLAQGGAQGYLTQKEFIKTKIPLPPLDIQEQIVKELDGYQAIIDGARQIINNWKPKIDIDPEWEMVKLGEVCDVKSGGTPSKTEISYWEGGDIPRLRSECCKDKIVNSAEDFITKIGLESSSAKFLKKGTTLVALVGATIGKTAYLNFEATTNQNIAGLYPADLDILDTVYLWLAIQTLYSQFNRLGDGNFKMANLSFVRSLEIPLPPLDIQKSIVTRIQHEQSLVDSAKELVRIYEEKVRESIERVWRG